MNEPRGPVLVGAVVAVGVRATLAGVVVAVGPAAKVEGGVVAVGPATKVEGGVVVVGRAAKVEGGVVAMVPAAALMAVTDTADGRVAAPLESAVRKAPLVGMRRSSCSRPGSSAWNFAPALRKSFAAWLM